MPPVQVLVFVSSRRQTRLTALDLIAYAAADDRPRQFLRLPDADMEQHLATVKVRGSRGADLEMATCFFSVSTNL